jgi:hypothetical protein
MLAASHRGVGAVAVAGMHCGVTGLAVWHVRQTSFSMKFFVWHCVHTHSTLYRGIGGLGGCD